MNAALTHSKHAIKRCDLAIIFLIGLCISRSKGVTFLTVTNRWLSVTAIHKEMIAAYFKLDDSLVNFGEKASALLFNDICDVVAKYAIPF